jgi:predicted transcriptional regulator
LDKLVLELDSRRRIFDTVCKYPGMHLREIGRVVGLSPNLVDYHLLYLEKREFVYSHQDGQYKCYFPRDAITVDGNRVNASDWRIVRLLRQRIPFRITLLILKNGTITHGEITRDVRKSPSTVSHHLMKLTAVGIISKNPSTSEYSISDSTRVEGILLRFNPRPETLTDGFLEIWDDLVI